jgi:proteasome lid subunit RPN8/RPN11
MIMKMDLVKSKKPESTMEDIALWLQSHPNAQLKLVSQYVAGGSIWTSLFYEE